MSNAFWLVVFLVYLFGMGGFYSDAKINLETNKLSARIAAGFLAIFWPIFFFIMLGAYTSKMMRDEVSRDKQRAAGKQ